MALNNNIFSLRKSDEEEKNTNSKISSSGNISLSQWGWDKASALKGNEVGLKVCLQQIYQDHKQKVRSDETTQEKAKAPLRVKLQERLGKIETFKNRVTKIKELELPEKKAKISTLNERIRDIQKHPEDIIGSKSGKAAYYIGLTILIFLTIYLFVFYSSASFSAFFKDFTPNSLGIADSIFDPQALSSALNDGFFELVLILTIPFVFLGLGFLIDQFKNQKSLWKVPKVALLILVTFIFDAILAFEITEKIYSLNAQASFQNSPDYTLSYAFNSVSFWLIIFAGFVAYIIWGLVFSFVMEAYENLDKVHMAIKTKKSEIKEINSQVNVLEEEQRKLEYLIGENQTEIEKLRESLEQAHFIDYKELENRIMQFLNGWLEWMSANRKNKDEQENIHDIVETFIDNNIKVA